VKKNTSRPALTDPVMLSGRSQKSPVPPTVIKPDGRPHRGPRAGVTPAPVNEPVLQVSPVSLGLDERDLTRGDLLAPEKLDDSHTLTAPFPAAADQGIAAVDLNHVMPAES